MQAHNKLQEHSALEGVAIQTISGRLHVHVAGNTIDMPAGHLLVLDQNVAHGVEALEESAFLLTVAGPERR